MKQTVELKDGRKITVHLNDGDTVRETGIYNKQGQLIAIFPIKAVYWGKVTKPAPFGVRGAI